MIREKRKTTVAEHYQIPLICYPRKRKKNPKKKIPEPCEYQTIPFPLKFVYSSRMYFLYGGLSLQEKNGTLVAEIPSLNKFLRCKEIQVHNQNHNKIISVAIEKNVGVELPAWQHVVRKLENSEESSLQYWGKLIKDYCLKYEEKLRVLSNKEKLIAQYSEEYLKTMNKEAEEKTAKFFDTYPCINFRSTVCNNALYLSDIVFNEKYLQELGYSIDTFALQTLQEGLPHLMPSDNTHAVQTLMENYYSLEHGGCHTPELISELTIKKGYTRKVNFKVHYFATYANNTFGMDCVLMLTGKEPPHFPDSNQDSQLNKKFVKKLVDEEKETNKFLKNFYNTSLNFEYTNIQKVCHIKPIDNAQT